MGLSIKNWKSQKKLPDDSKYITIKEFHQLSGERFDKRLKQAKLATTNDLDNVKQLATKNKEKIEKLQTYDSSLFIGQSYFGNDGFPRFFIFQSICKTFKIPVVLQTQSNNVYLKSKRLSNEKRPPAT